MQISNDEVILQETIFKSWNMHPRSPYTYMIPKSYWPDKTKVIGDKTFILEVKGWMKTREEATKYLNLKTQLPEGHELVFFFLSPTCTMAGAAKRKDGTRQKQTDWAERNGIRWTSKKRIVAAAEEWFGDDIPRIHTLPWLSQQKDWLNKIDDDVFLRSLEM